MKKKPNPKDHPHSKQITGKAKAAAVFSNQIAEFKKTAPKAFISTKELGDCLAPEQASLLDDKREKELPDSAAAAVAIQARLERIRREHDGIPSRRGARFLSWDEILTRAAIAGDVQFFRDLADAFEILESRGIEAYTEDGLIAHVRNAGGSYILAHWEEWENDGLKIEARLQETKEKTGMSKSKANWFITEAGLRRRR